MKIRTSIKIATLAAFGALGLTLGGLFSFAGSGTFFTYVDNDNNAGTGVADGDMATTSLVTEPTPPTIGASNPIAPIEFNISVATLPTQSASLTIRGWDIDEEQGEQDDVYLNGVLLGKLMNKLSGGKINPLIGSAGVSAVPMAARVSQVEGQKANPGNFLLMHAMGPNVAGVIGSAIAAGILLSMFGA